jgi:hypothetical protein
MYSPGLIPNMSSHVPWKLTLPHGSRPGSAGVRKAAGATGAADVAVAGAARRSILSGFGKIQQELVTFCWKFSKQGSL